MISIGSFIFYSFVGIWLDACWIYSKHPTRKNKFFFANQRMEDIRDAQLHVEGLSVVFKKYSCKDKQ